MKTIFRIILLSILFLTTGNTNLCAQKADDPKWRLQVDKSGRYLEHADGKPFFWLGQTSWLLTQRLNRDEIDYFVTTSAKQGYNVIQISPMHAIPSYNIYGAPSVYDGFSFDKIGSDLPYGYWDHVDYLINAAKSKKIYIAIVCVWGGTCRGANLSADDMKRYGEFLANRYKDYPNVIWMMGGDINGTVKQQEYITLANTIKSIDKHHLMTYHPRGRTMSCTWFNDREWLDFNMFQSGHRRYGQRNGDKNYPIEDDTEEDNWRYVNKSLSCDIIKPVIDGEPIYEDIPQGLHDVNEKRWTDSDCRRYAYWSVFAGAFGHTYGHNDIMQITKPGINGAYGADGITKAWFHAMGDPGCNQMIHLKNLALYFDYRNLTPDNSVILDNGTKYEYLTALRNDDVMLVYNYASRGMKLDISKLKGEKKQIWRYDVKRGDLEFDAEVSANTKVWDTHGPFIQPYGDHVMIIFNSDRQYLKQGWKNLPSEYKEKIVFED